MKISDKLVNLRTGRYGEEVRAQVISGELIPLGTCFAFPREEWNELEQFERNRIEAIAHGRAATKAVLVSRSAARVHNMWTVPLTPDRVELCLPSGYARSDSGVHPRIKWRRTHLNPKRLLTIEGARVTSPTRTFVDVARYHGFHEGLVAADWLLRNGFTIEDLEREVWLAGRLKGIASARRCISFASHLSEAPGEALAKAICIDAGYKGFQQYRVGPFRADLFIEGVLVEVDGRQKYKDNTEAVLTAEQIREKNIRNAGYEFVRVTMFDLIERPDHFLESLRRNIEKVARLRAAT